MKGSEKQVDYAEILRASMIESIKSAMTMNADYFEDFPGTEKHYESVLSSVANFTGYAGNMIDCCKGNFPMTAVQRLIDGTTTVQMGWKNVRDNK